MPATEITILHIEDDKNHANLIARIFRKLGAPCRIILMDNGAEALDYLLQVTRPQKPFEYGKPDLILLDLRLPLVDGLEVLKTIKGDQQLRNIPVIILTSSETAEDILNSYNLGANGYLTKPTNFNDLQAMLHSFVQYWIQFNRLPVTPLRPETTFP